MNKTSTPKKNIESFITQMNEKLDNKNEFPFEPGNNVVNNILNYSKALSVRKAKSIGHIEVVLN